MASDLLLAKALTFDVFGTCVDVYGTLENELQRFGNAHTIVAEWKVFAKGWIGGYAGGVNDVCTGIFPWIDAEIGRLQVAVEYALLMEVVDGSRYPFH